VQAEPQQVVGLFGVVDEFPQSPGTWPCRKPNRASRCAGRRVRQPDNHHSGLPAVARIAGGFVMAVDIEDHKLTMATELGADYVVNALTTDPVETIQALGGADVAVALATSPGAFDQAYRSLRCGGRLACVALPADNAR
jgi:hypothetical protein